MESIITNHFISLKTTKCFYVLKYNEIVFLEEVCGKTKVHYLNHAIQHLDLSLDEVEMELKKLSFWRSGPDHVINLKYLEKVTFVNDNTIELKGNHMIKVDEIRKKILMNALSNIT